MFKIVLKLLVIVSIILLSANHIVTSETNTKKIKNFSVVSPLEAVKDMSPGWNLGNTLDAIPTETSWGNPATEAYIFDDIKNSGFKSIRLPVTWTDHIGPAPDYKVDPEWMDRVEQVTDWALERDLYVVLNAHHDSWMWMTKMVEDPITHKKSLEDYDNSIIKFEKLWQQIAERFKYKNEKLLFEVINEPDGTAAQVNEINSRILKVIRNSGGNNKYRLVLLPTRGTNTGAEAITKFVLPNDNYVVVTCHYYVWPFFLRGAPTWGNFQERQTLENEFANLNRNFVKKGIPVIIGEYGADQSNEAYYLWFYLDSIVQTAHKDGLTTMLWDNGTNFGGFNRTKRVWTDPVIPDIIVNASKGIPNSFVIQPTIYVRANTPIIDHSANLKLNGNQLKGIYNGEYSLFNGIDYILTKNNSKVTIKKEYLKKLIKPAQIGINANLTFKFSQGADQIVKVIQYDQPTISQTSITVDTTLEEHQNLTIPIDFKGLQPAYVSAVEKKTKKPIKDNRPNLDDGNVWYNEDMTTTTLSGRWVLNRIKEDTLITFHFWPRNVKAEIDVKALKEK
jgi:endoglucanase